MTPGERAALEAAAAQLRAGAARGWDEGAEPHVWAARVLLDGLAGGEGERPAWHLQHGRHAEAAREIAAALTTQEEVPACAMT